jgi:hypothetical protein
MREEAREALQVVQRRLDPLRQRLKRALGQVALLSLNRAKLVDNDRPVPQPDVGGKSTPAIRADIVGPTRYPPGLSSVNGFLPQLRAPHEVFSGPERFTLRKATLDSSTRSLYDPVALA